MFAIVWGNSIMGLGDYGEKEKGIYCTGGKAKGKSAVYRKNTGGRWDETDKENKKTHKNGSMVYVYCRNYGD